MWIEADAKERAAVVYALFEEAEERFHPVDCPTPRLKGTKTRFDVRRYAGSVHGAGD
jgi:hypothetical protein